LEVGFIQSTYNLEREEIGNIVSRLLQGHNGRSFCYLR
jgi:hypothetical protein